ncbi:MAG: ABC transporter permease [Bryobacteraceae bacterium]|jgi:putative ABC transport system permease protein
MNRRQRALAGLEEDIREHLDRETRDNIERGMPPGEARAAAVRKFGNVAMVEEETRAVWRRPWVDQLLQDLGFAFRVLRRAPAFTAVAILTLAVGIGLNTAVFSVVNSVLLRPLDYPHPERLVWLGEYDTFTHHDMVMLSDFAEWRTHARSYSAMAAFSYQQIAVANSRGAFPVSAVLIGGDFWTLSGASPALGRLFAPSEPSSLVVSWEVFQRQFGADPHVIGSAVTVDGRAATVCGVLPKGYRFQFPRWWAVQHPEPVEAYLPIDQGDPKIRGRGGQVVASLKPGVSISQALAELKLIQQSLHPPAPPSRLHIDPLLDQLTSGARRALAVLLAAGSLLLLMASVNIASLLLARASARRRELAIRLAMGAGRFRALRQLLVESLTLALLGGAAGLLLARCAIALLVRLGPQSIPRLDEVAMDICVLAFTICISIAAGILFGVAPGVALWRTDLHDALKEGARSTGGAFGLRIRRLLVAGEMAMAVVLLTGAGLLLASFLRMNARPAGFAPEKVLLMKIRLAGTQYTPAAQQGYRNELLRRLGSTPGVESAGISTQFGWSGAPAFPNDPSPTQTHVLHLNAASPGYFRAIGMQLLKGRWLSDADQGGVVMLNESMAREAFGAVDPIGRSLSAPQPAVVIGVLADLRYSHLDADAPPEVFLPFPNRMMLSFDLAVRAANPAGLLPSIRREMAALDPTQPAYDVKTLDRALADSIAPHRFNLFLLGTFAASAFVLALVGIYGVIAYAVAARTREIGVRVALGAQRGDVVGMVVREGMAIAIAGIVAGMAAALALTRLMASLLYGVNTTDPRIFAAASVTLAVTALLASWWPARKAAGIDPTIALRDE